MYYGVFKGAWKVIVLVKEKRCCQRWEKEMCASYTTQMNVTQNALWGLSMTVRIFPIRQGYSQEKEEFNKYIVDNDTDVLMVNEECYTYEVQKKSDSNVIVLCEEESEAKKINDKKRDGHTGVCKYQQRIRYLELYRKKA